MKKTSIGKNMIHDMDRTCGLIAVGLLVLLFLNLQKEYRMSHRLSPSACSMAVAEESDVSAKQSLSIEPKAIENDGTSPLDVGVLNKDVWTGDVKELTEAEKKTQDFLDEYITTIHEDKFKEHMTSGCNANISKPTYKKIVEAGAVNRPDGLMKPTFSKNLGNAGWHSEARKFYAPDTEKCTKPSFDLYFNGNEAHFEAQKCE